MLNRAKTPLLTALGLLVIIVLVAIVWFATRSAQPDTATKSANTAPPVSRTLRFGLNIAADSALHAAALRFAEQISERSKGAITVSVHPDQQLGSDDQMLEMARQGKLDLLLTPTAKLSSAIPAMQYPDLPFYFAGQDELYEMLDGEPGQMLLAKLKAIDLVGLAFWENGFKQFTANRPIHNPQDFAGLRVRTMKSRIIADQFESLGARAIPIDFHATYQALADGAVDGQENPLVAIVGMRFHEVQKHLTLSNHAYLGYVFSTSKTVFESLSPELRQLIQQTARELTVWEREETARREDRLLETIRAAGVTIHTLTPDERVGFRKAMAPVADKFGFEIGYDLFAKTEELRFAKQAGQPAAHNVQPKIIGLDTDLSVVGPQAGGAIYRGVQLAIEDINQKGGVLGTPLQLLARDHAGNPSIGRQNLERFAALPSLLGVIGGMHSSVITDELPDIHRLQIPYMIPWAAAQGLINHTYRPSYTFRISVNDAQVAPFLLQKALAEGKHVTVLLERSAWGRSNEAALVPLLEKLPNAKVNIDWINIGDPLIETKIDTLVRAGNDALVLVANGMENVAVVQAMARQEKPLPIFSHWGLTGSNFWKQVQVPLQRVDLRFVQSILADGNESNPRLEKFLKRYRERYGLSRDDTVPSQAGSIHAYDLTQLLALATNQARSTDRASIRNALESIKEYPGLVRDYRLPFTPERHDALDHTVLHLARFDARGRIVRAE